MQNITPSKVVEFLDKYIVGQQKAKKALAVSLRNRYRRKHVAEDLRDEISPKNILMIGPTGVGKTELSRRMAKMLQVPFIKVEATKFTEVGYVGRDVESIIRDLVDIAIKMLKKSAQESLDSAITQQAIERVLTVLVGQNASQTTRDAFRKKIESGEISNTEIEIEVEDNPQQSGGMMEIPGMPGAAMGMISVGDIIGKALGGEVRKKLKKMKVSKAIESIKGELFEQNLDKDSLHKGALELVEQDGIVFLDEIDKLITSSEKGGRGEVSREGVQRDLLPLIEGTTVPTKYGQVRTDNILFIASGAFHLSKPSDLFPELQGRLPIRVELESLSEDDLYKILTQTENSLIKQAIAMLEVESFKLSFNDDALREIAKIASTANQNIENIGARRLHTILEKVLEDISFSSPDMAPNSSIEITRPYIQDKVKEIMENKNNIASFIL